MIHRFYVYYIKLILQLKKLKKNNKIHEDLKNNGYPKNLIRNIFKNTLELINSNPPPFQQFKLRESFNCFKII